MAASQPARSRSMTDRLDALKFELKADIAKSELRLTERLEARIEALRQDTRDRIESLARDLASLAQDFKEFKGTAKGVAIVISTLVPTVTALAVVALNLVIGRPHLP